MNRVRYVTDSATLVPFFVVVVACFLFWVRGGGAFFFFKRFYGVSYYEVLELL